MADVDEAAELARDLGGQIQHPADGHPRGKVSIIRDPTGAALTISAFPPAPFGASTAPERTPNGGGRFLRRRPLELRQYVGREPPAAGEELLDLGSVDLPVEGLVPAHHLVDLSLADPVRFPVVSPRSSAWERRISVLGLAFRPPLGGRV